MSETKPEERVPEKGADKAGADQDNLDEAWVGLTQLLTATAIVNGTASEAALVEAVCRRLARRQARRRRMVLALAASLLAVVSLATVGGKWLSINRGDAPVAVLPPGTGPSSDTSVAPRVKPVTGSAATDATAIGDTAIGDTAIGDTAIESTAKGNPAGELAASAVWNDDWDDELAQAQEEVLATKESWRQPTDSMATVRQRMYELETEFGDGAL